MPQRFIPVRSDSMVPSQVDRTGTSSGTSVIWTWSYRTESGTRYVPALDVCLLTFWCRKCQIHAPLTFWQLKRFTRC